MLQTSAHIVSTQFLPPEMGTRFRFFGKPTIAPCHLAGSAPHKSEGRRVKSWPDDTHKHSPTLNLVIWICDLCIYIIYYRFIVRFPIRLDFLFITFLLHLFMSWTSSLSISSYAISASTLSNHVLLGLPTVFCLQL